MVYFLWFSEVWNIWSLVVDKKSPNYKIWNRAVGAEEVHPCLGLLFLQGGLSNLSWDFKEESSQMPTFKILMRTMKYYISKILVYNCFETRSIQKQYWCDIFISIWTIQRLFAAKFQVPTSRSARTPGVVVYPIRPQYDIQ